MTTLTEDDFCQNPVQRMRDKLFSRICLECGTLPVYTDDGQFIISSNNRDRNQDNLEKCFWRIRDWLNANGLKMNEAKTNLTEFMSHQKRAKARGIPPDLTVDKEIENRDWTIRLEDKMISDKTNCRLLGINIQNNLIWDAHLSSGKKAILPAVRRQLRMISTISRNMSRKVRLQLVNALALSKLTYMMCLWGNASTNHIKKAQVVLNSAARLVTGRKKTTRQRYLMEDCGWLAITEWTEYLALAQL